MIFFKLEYLKNYLKPLKLERQQKHMYILKDDKRI